MTVATSVPPAAYHKHTRVQGGTETSATYMGYVPPCIQCTVTDQVSWLNTLNTSQYDEVRKQVAKR